MNLKRKRSDADSSPDLVERVRLHLIDPNPHFHLPSVEGILMPPRLVAPGVIEYAIAVAELVTDPSAGHVQMDSKLLMVPAANVAFYEVL